MATILTRVRQTTAALSRALPRFRGKTRIVTAIDAVLSVQSPTCYTHGSGVRFVLSDAADHIEREVLYSGDFSPDIRKLLASLIGAGASTYWDVGANIGSIALPLLAEFPALRAFLFEPSPQVLARLLRNVAANTALIDRVQIYGLALSNAPGPVEFWTSAEAHNSGVGGLGPSHNRAAFPLRSLGTTVDELLKDGVPAPQVMKIDVEGFEREVLEGMRGLLSSKPDLAIVLEHSLYRFAERKRPHDWVVGWLRDQGLLVHSTEGGEIGPPVDAAALAREGDFVALSGSYAGLAR